MVEILCLGDSLTEGYVDRGRSYHPYGTTLQNMLDRNGKVAQVTVVGRSGERVARQRMMSHLQHKLNLFRKQGIMFDCAIIMGGINDVFDCTTAETIFQALAEMYEMCFEAGVAHVFGCTLLEVGDENLEDLPFGAARNQVNTLIKNYTYTPSVPIAETSAATAPTFHALDTSTLFPLHSLSSKERKHRWDKDMLHLTKDGYAELGKVVFEGIQGIF